MKVLFPHQATGLSSLRDALRSGARRPLCMAPTGAGKTVLMASIADSALAKGNRVVVTVPRIDLIDQTIEAFAGQGISDVGVIQADHPRTDPAAPVQVASLQTLRNRPLPDGQLVLVDEAHERSKFLGRWMAEPDWQGVPFIGFSATPWSAGLGKQFDQLVVIATTRGLIADGFLSPFRVFAPSHPDLTGIRTVRGDFDETQLGAAMLKGALVADIVTTWLAKGESRPTMCFCVNRIHAKTLQARFTEVGVSCGYIDGYSSPDERREVRRQFHAREIDVVCNVGVLTTGVDWDVRCIILARPTKSEILYTQIIGRGLRTAEGKADCLILDHSDTTLRLGFVTDIHHTTLDDGEGKVSRLRSDGIAQPKECPKCHYVREPRVGSCPACGYVPEATSKVENVAGELVDLTAARRLNNGDGWPEKISFMRQLIAAGIERGYKRQWADSKYREKYGVWPNDRRVSDVLPAKGVTPEVRSWIKSRQIAFAKRRGA